MAKKQSKKAVKKIAKEVIKETKKGNKAAIALVVVVVIAVIAVGVLYVLRPDIFSFLNQGQNDLDSTGNGSLLDNSIHEGDLNIYYIDVGQGDCIYIQFPDGKDMLIDCGNETNSSAQKETTLASLDNYEPDGTIDYLMLTHSDQDHVSYLDEILGSYQVNNIYMPNIKAGHSSVAEANLDQDKLDLFTDPDEIDTKVYADFFIAALSEPNCNINLNIGIFPISGENWKIDFFGYTLEEWTAKHLNNAEAKNAVSPIGILQYNGKKVVLTGDSNEINEPLAIEKMKAYYGIESLDCDVLKVGHHGSETSSVSEFLDFITCEYAVILCGTGNKYAHPREETMARLRERNMTIYRTDLQGDIKMVISSSTITFQTAKTASEAELNVGLAG